MFICEGTTSINSSRYKHPCPSPHPRRSGVEHRKVRRVQCLELWLPDKGRTNKCRFDWRRTADVECLLDAWFSWLASLREIEHNLLWKYWTDASIFQLSKGKHVFMSGIFVQCSGLMKFRLTCTYLSKNHLNHSHCFGVKFCLDVFFFVRKLPQNYRPNWYIGFTF